MYTIISSPSKVLVVASTQSEAERVGTKFDDPRVTYTWGPQISPAGLLTLLEIMLENIDLEKYNTKDERSIALWELRADLVALRNVLSNAGVEHAPPLEV